MKTLVTGGAGFIGSHIVDRLIELGHEVGVVDNLRSGKKENINPKATFFEVDVTDKNKLTQVITDFSPQAIFHLAAQNEVPYSMAHPFEDNQMNIIGMMNLLEAAKDKKIKVIYSNTGGAYYGEVQESDLPITEDLPVRFPTSFYGVSKLSAEVYLRLYGNVYQVPWVSLRYSNVYGPRQAGNREAGIVAIFVDKMIKGEVPTINGDGKHSRDYVYVADVVEANIKALEAIENNYFNVSTGKETTNIEVYDMIEENLKTGKKPNFGPERLGDPRKISLSPQKAKELLGWVAKVDFAQGVKRTVEFYKAAK